MDALGKERDGLERQIALLESSVLDGSLTPTTSSDKKEELAQALEELNGLQEEEEESAVLARVGKV